MPSWCPGGPISKVEVTRDGRLVRVRHTFCCRRHYVVPWIETDHTPEGALKMASDLTDRALEALNAAIRAERK